MEKFYIGISLGFNSSACLMSNKRGLISAVSQERVNGEKNTKRFPIDAIKACIGNIAIDEIDAVGICCYQPITNKWLEKYFDDVELEKYTNLIDSDPITSVVNIISSELGMNVNDRYRVEHHNAHAISSQVFHGFPESNALLITSDGFGDGVSSRISTSDGEVLSTLRIGSSVALVYQFTTGALGFTEHKHEGKITGLAAYGKPIYDFSPLVGSITEYGPRQDNIDKVLVQSESEISAIEDFDIFSRLRLSTYEFVNNIIDSGGNREDVAASVQHFAENTTTNWINSTIERYDSSRSYNAYLSGGLFANVKINQRIHESKYIDSVFVAPPMGDEGTSVGAAYFAMSSSAGNVKHLFTCKKSALVGTSNSITREDLVEIAGNSGCGVMFTDTAEQLSSEVAVALSNNKIVCLYNGRMEFGPRALCNRSIMYQCGDASVNQWLNEKLSRTEFMPFAPFCKKDHASDLFKNIEGAEQTAEYMTITFDCTDEFIKDYPAACHVDNTARPQLITEESNELAHAILSQYFDITGKKALINTSFNLHNHPIIESIETAIESWLLSGTDLLVVNDAIIWKNK